MQLARAGDQRTKRFYEKKVFALKNQAMNVGTRISAKNYLEEKDQAVFYSSWIYAALRLLSAIPEFQTRSALAEALDLPPAKINQVLEFLISRGLCIEKGGRIQYAEKRTYVDQDSPFVIRHHANWRQRAISHLDRLSAEDLAFTNAIVVGGNDFLRIREEAVQFIERFKKIAEPSPSEELCCLTLDWFRIKG